MKKKLAFLAVALMMTWGANKMGAQTSPPECWGVRCAACPAGTTWSPVVGNCCRCVPNQVPQECWNVRCAACPPGTTWSPVVGNCCRCI